MTNSLLDVVVDWVSGVDHDSVDELHGLSTLATELARDDNFTTLGLGFHDEAENTITGTADG